MVDPVKAVEDVKDKVVETGKGWFMDLVSSPLSFIKGVAFAPFRAVGGALKGIYNSTIGDLYGVLVTSSVVAAAAKFTPDLVAWLPPTVNNKKVGTILGEDMIEGGTASLIKDSLIVGVGLKAAIGAVGGAVGGAMDSSGGKDTPVAEKIGGGLAGLATVAGLGFLAATAFKNNHIGFAGPDDGATTKTPASTPASAPDAAKGATKA